MNALHCFYYGVWCPDKDYLFEVTKLLVEYGVNLNAQDFNVSIPLHYLITLNKLLTEDIKEVLVYLVEKGSDYKLKNKYRNSCLDGAKKFGWRNEFLDIIKEYEESKSLNDK